MRSNREFKVGDRVFIVANNVSVQELEILRIEGEYYTLRELDRYGAIRLRRNRLFATLGEANQELQKQRGQERNGYIRPY